MKLLVLAHVPPPHHGQSVMVEQLLAGLAQGGEIECLHVNAQFSGDIQEIGYASVRKVFLALKFSARAIWLRFRHGVRHLYYVPAPPVRVAIYRDWILMALCRPFFPNLILHWHAVGLGEWLETRARPWERMLTRWLLGRPKLSLVLGEYNRRDAVALDSQRTVIVPNGVPDPCPRYAAEVRPLRLARASGGPKDFTLLFIGLCVRSKGLFDAVEAVALANAESRAAGRRDRVRLQVAGRFHSDAERAEFDARVTQPDLVEAGVRHVEYLGFISGEDKNRRLIEADALVFPTYYEAESFGLVAVEAMAFGLPVIATRWRTVPELFPAGYPWLVEPRSPAQLAAAMTALRSAAFDDALRDHYVAHFTDRTFLARIRQGLCGGDGVGK